MTDDHAPDEAYEAVARDRFTRWGYDETIGDEGRKDYVAKESQKPNLRRDADVVWRMAKGMDTA